MNLSEIHSSDLTRLCVQVGDPDAWQEFVRRFQKPIALTVLRICRQWGSYSSSAVDDLVQETFLRLCTDQCKILRNFVADSGCADPLAALVRTVAANVTHDYFRIHKAKKRGGSRQRVALEGPNEEILSDVWSSARSLEREIQIREIERTLQSAPESDVSPTERLVFGLYFRQGMSASAIALVPALRLSTKGVESAVHRVKNYLRSRLNPGIEIDKYGSPEGKSQQISMRGEEAR